LTFLFLSLLGAGFVFCCRVGVICLLPAQKKAFQFLGNGVGAKKRQKIEIKKNGHCLYF